MEKDRNVFSDADGKIEGDACAVCMEELRERHCDTAKFSCKHSLHFECAIAFILSNVKNAKGFQCDGNETGVSISCPVCRSSIKRETIGCIRNILSEKEIVFCKNVNDVNREFSSSFARVLCK